jgi:TRAP-type mannitol/chloroaromatic compound transport system permease small subunit
MRILGCLLDLIDSVNRVIGKSVGYLVPILACVILFEVCMRYFFKVSQSWTFEMSQFLFGILFILGGGYTLYHKEHVNVDVIYHRLSLKNKTIIEIITSIFIFIYLGVLIWKGWDLAYRSYQIGERTVSGWAPAIWPIKLLIPIGAVLILFQAVANIIRQAIIVFGKRGAE